MATKKKTKSTAKSTKKESAKALAAIEKNIQAIEAAESPPKAKGKKAAKEKPAKEKKPSAIDAAARLLAESKEPLNCRQMIEQMAAKGLWTSPGGKTPHATLFSAIIREIAAKGKESRFKKTERGHFTATT